MLEECLNWIRSFDDLTKPINTKFHTGGEKQSILGGIVSLSISLYMTWLIYSKSFDMFTYYKPRTGT